MSVFPMLGLIVFTAGCGSLPMVQVDPRRIEEIDRPIDECSVHKKPLVVAVEPLSDVGCVQYSLEYHEARKRLFPCAMEEMSNKYSPPGKTHWLAHYCPDCRKAKREWQEETCFMPEEREILRRFIEGKSIERAGAEMGLDPDVARSRFAIAVDRLSRLVERADKLDAAR